MTRSRFLRFSGLAAMLAGLLFVAIQPIHPPDTVASVATAAWVVVHSVTLAMTMLFIVGLAGIQARQSAATGWPALTGLVALVLGLLLTAAFVFMEAFISPVLAETNPAFVDDMLALVAGTASDVHLGALPVLWTASGVLFLGGCLGFGVATIRAGILPRWASGVFAFGLPVVTILISLLPYDLHRIGAMPIGLGLAWMGYAIWSEPHDDAADPAGGTRRSDRAQRRLFMGDRRA